MPEAISTRLRRQGMSQAQGCPRRGTQWSKPETGGMSQTFLWDKSRFCLCISFVLQAAGHSPVTIWDVRIASIQLRRILQEIGPRQSRGHDRTSLLVEGSWSEYWETSNTTHHHVLRCFRGKVRLISIKVRRCPLIVKSYGGNCRGERKGSLSSPAMFQFL